jgi:hypothetical protein
MVWCCGPIDVLRSEEGTTDEKNGGKQNTSIPSADFNGAHELSNRDDLVSGKLSTLTFECSSVN